MHMYCIHCISPLSASSKVATFSPSQVATFSPQRGGSAGKTQLISGFFFKCLDLQRFSSSEEGFWTVTYSDTPWRFFRIFKKSMEFSKVFIEIL